MFYDNPRFKKCINKIRIGEFYLEEETLNEFKVGEFNQNGRFVVGIEFNEGPIAHVLVTKENKTRPSELIGIELGRAEYMDDNKHYGRFNNNKEKKAFYNFMCKMKPSKDKLEKALIDFNIKKIPSTNWEFSKYLWNITPEPTDKIYLPNKVTIPDYTKL